MRRGLLLAATVFLLPAQAHAGSDDSWTVVLAGVVVGEVLCEEKLPEDIRRQIVLRSWTERSDTEATLRTIRMISATTVDRGRSDEKFRSEF